ncbi:alpha/beta fold hydrolase, partial [Aetokthonos hydrillicola]|uniref:alpha/beta fold hydrolase n=1 Tax=Aetokthonos hydrillicola TaxID=1550245 RepID=UPI003BB6E98D
MFPNFLPTTVSQLTEATSIALAQSIEQTAISTPLSPQPINTTYVHQGSGGIPLLLIHGFDSSILEFRRVLPLLAAHHETLAVDLLVNSKIWVKPALGKQDIFLNPPVHCSIVEIVTISLIMDYCR